MADKPESSPSPAAGARIHKSCDACKARKVRCPSMFPRPTLAAPKEVARLEDLVLTFFGRLWAARSLCKLCGNYTVIMHVS